jgi:hypothetical protein
MCSCTPGKLAVLLLSYRQHKISTNPMGYYYVEWQEMKKELPEIRVRLERCKPGEKAVKLNYPDNLGLRTKLGGKPDEIQPDEIPVCDSCGKQMTFVAQIDSVEHWADNNPLSRNPLEEKQDYMFGDVAMIYVWFCFNCCEPKSTFECY